jgi:preprotein translocase subunit SecE
MSGVAGTVTAVRTYFEDVKVELKKSAWPTRSELVESTVVIIVSVIALGCFVGASDWVLEWGIKQLVR